MRLPPGSRLVIVIFIGFTAPPFRDNHKGTKAQRVFLTFSFVHRQFTKIERLR